MNAMNTPLDDDILDDLFHGSAVASFIDQAIEQGGPPDDEATGKCAFRYYEEALTEKNARRDETSTTDTGNGVLVA